MTVTTNLQQLKEDHHEILRQAFLGKTNVQIAKETGRTKEGISHIIRSAPGKELLANMNATANYNAVEIAQEIRELAPQAVRVMQELMESPEASPMVKLRAAMDVLDRSGHAAVKKVDVRSTSLSLTAEDLQAIKERAYALNPNVVPSGTVVDV